MRPEQRANTVGSRADARALYPPPKMADETYPLSDKSIRKQLTEQVTQYNPLSIALKNDDRICGACSVVNAILLSDDHQAASAALEQVFRGSGAVMPSPLELKDAERALAALASGKVTHDDVAVLQQVAAAVLDTLQLYADAERANRKGDKPPVKPARKNSDGIDAPVLHAFVGGLRAMGAKFPETTFELSENKRGAHWTTTVGGVHADSAPSRDARTQTGSFKA